MGRIDLETVQKISLDSNCFIYLMEGSPYEKFLLHLFRKIENGDLQAVTSTLTVTEILSHPYKKGNIRLVEEYRGLLSSFPNMKVRAVDFHVADRAAELRNQYRLKTPDAIQLATAILEDTQIFVTNDKDFSSVDFPIVYLQSNNLR
ncbi:type II toxin-antitoxin system VapC family toxin [Effusibacillus lacus]|uniref:Twitching motility protein PilT n=1 Tax=Effusibacillus lacus TaxID=1348429 RepID=A0A292YLH5_9BACL|nr:PIN domain-containing protein [Effusibacillus lacus]TCS72841.1 putative nucleic acid-binding protein [Effusibacillus lacus]GAX89234.1 twitching motility protein PilT [Effusibacillus lacus]